MIGLVRITTENLPYTTQSKQSHESSWRTRAIYGRP